MPLATLQSGPDERAVEAATSLTSPHARPAHALAQRLLGDEVRAAEAPDDLAAAAEGACGRVLGNLARWVGRDGAGALFARALAHARLEHPVLRSVRYVPSADVCLEGLAESARSHGTPAVVEGVLGILTAVIELLGRLIGDDMVMQLVDHRASAPAPDDEPFTGERDTQ